MNNEYLTYLKTELGNHLYRMIDKDRSNYYQNQEKKHVKSIEIDSFFDFYLDTLSFTPKELITNLKGSHSKLIEVFYEPRYQKFEQRKSWISKFKEEIKNNTQNLFYLSFEQCLKSHGQYLGNDYEIPAIKDHYVKENFDLFKELVQIGKEKDYFNNKEESYFHTSNTLYKNYLEQENIFNPQFDFNHLKNELTAYSGNNSKSVQTYIHTYMSEIFELFRNNSYLIEELSEKKLLPLLMRHICITEDPEVKKIQTNFLDTMISNRYIRLALFDENSSKKDFICNFPSLLKPYLGKLEESEKKLLFNNLGYEYDNFDKNSFYRSSISSIINIIIQYNIPTDLNTFSIIIDNLISYNKDLKEQDLKSYAGNLAMQFSIKSIKQVSPPESAENIIFIDKYLSFFNDIFKNDDSHIKFSKKLTGVKTLLEYTQENNPATYKKINQIFMKQWENIILETWQADNHRIKEKITNASYLLKELNKHEILDSINKHNLQLEKVYHHEIPLQNKKVKQMPNFPLIFSLFENNPEIVMPWILKSDNLDKIKEIKYKNKNIVEFFADSKHINLIIEHLTQDDNAFKKLIIDNKKASKKLANHENKALKIATTHHGMSINLKEKENQSVRNKI